MEPLTSFLDTRNRLHAHVRGGFRRSRPAPPLKGFTIVEMLVSVGIILIITSVVLLGQNSFNRNLVLVDTTYTIASTVRQAQSLGLASRKFGSTQNSGYGVHFYTAANGISYLLFADTLPSTGTSRAGKCPGRSGTGLEAKSGNCTYDSAPEQVTSHTLNRGFKIANFCGVELPAAGGARRCSASGVNPLSDMDISFLRPSTQTTILGVSSGTIVEMVSADIHITSPDGAYERCVNVSKVGQVSVGVCP
jgi:prepilin-type N-terminal cleavage/methylation domain-containing protein